MWKISRDTVMPVTEQVPYGKPTTEALGGPAGGPANKRLAMAREEYLPGNWFKKNIYTRYRKHQLVRQVPYGKLG